MENTDINNEETSFEILENNIKEIGEIIANEPEPEPEPQPEQQPEPEQQTPVINNPINTGSIPVKTKKGRGRPKKDGNNTTKKTAKINIENTAMPPQEQSEADSLILLLNGTLIPIGSKIFNKKAEDCQIKDDQMKEIIKLRPESQLLGRSWLAYFGAIAGTAAANFIRANDDDKVLTVINAVKKMTPEQRIEVRTLLIGPAQNE